MPGSEPDGRSRRGSGQQPVLEGVIDKPDLQHDFPAAGAKRPERAERPPLHLIAVSRPSGVAIARADVAVIQPPGYHRVGGGQRNAGIVRPRQRHVPS